MASAGNLGKSGKEQQQGSFQGRQGKDGNADGAAKDASSSGKIFIGGLSRETTTEKLTNHFKKYGEISDSVIMKDKGSGHPRGFGFVTFADPNACARVLQEEQTIDGRIVDCKRSIPRENMAAVKGPKTKKIFVGGIPTTITEEEFRKHFSQFGKVLEQQIMLDHSTGRSRGFGFITYDNEQTVDDLLAQGTMHDFAGKQVEIKKAEPKRAPDAGGGPLAGSDAFMFSGRGSFDRYDDGYDLGSDFGYSSGSFRGSYGSRADAYGGYGGSYGGYGSSYGESSLDLAGYSGSAFGGYGSALGMFGGSLGGGYSSGFFGGYSDDAYGALGYGDGYSGAGYGGGYGPGGDYSGGYGSTRGYGGGANRRYHPYKKK